MQKLGNHQTVDLQDCTHIYFDTAFTFLHFRNVCFVVKYISKDILICARCLWIAPSVVIQ